MDYVQGYKIAVLKDGKYYSPTTGVEYKVGPVEIPDKQINSILDIVNDLLEEDSTAYSPTMVGRTCVMLNFNEAKEKYEDWKRSFVGDGELVLLEMSLKEGLMFGKYGIHNYVIGGKYINNFYRTWP